MRQRMQRELLEAMKQRDGSRIAVLRTTLAAIANAEAVDPSAATVKAGLLADVARRELSEDDIVGIVSSELDGSWDAEVEMRDLGQTSAADGLAARAAVRGA